MPNLLNSRRSAAKRPLAAGLALACAGALGIGAAVQAQPSAGGSQYAQVIGNDMTKCAAGKGPSVRLRITGLRSSKGNLFVRTYRARSGDWLKGKRYLTRIDAKPKAGVMTVCVPIPAAGQYAIAVQHDANGNRKTDFSSDGAAITNNPKIGSFLGIPRPPSVQKAAFSVGKGVTSMSVVMRYRD